MLKLVLLILGFVIACGSLTTAYIVIRSFHRKWKLQDRVNANMITQATIDDMYVEVLGDGSVRPTEKPRRAKHEVKEL